MTSEAPNRPGQEPGETSSGAGGPAPYGDRPAQQENGYGGAPDLGWAPPPPAGRPAPPAPAWAAPDDRPPAWQPGGPAPTGRATAQVPPAEPGGWGGPAQPAWAGQEQAPGWAPPAGSGEQAPAPWAAGPPNGSAEPAPWAAGPSNGSAEPNPPAWATPAGPGAPAWAAAPPPGAPQGEQPAWAQPGEPAPRGAAQVPAPATVPHEAWAGGRSQDDHRAGGQPDSGGWAAAHQQDDPNRSGGWGATAQEEQPAWGQQQAEPANPGWAPAEPPARAAAKVSVPAENGWPAQDDPARSGGWGAGATPDDDPDRSGGWAAGRAAETPQQPAWGGPDEQRAASGWNGTAAVPQQREQDEPAQPGWGGAPAPGDRPESGGWPPAEAPARAAASVPSPDSPPAWGGHQDNPPQWPERPAIPEAEPWSADEAWGRATEAQPERSPSNGWEPARGEEAPAYQPAPGPGISPANAVPLPPQEQRVPGAALAASPPADYGQFNPGDRDRQAYAPEQPGGWATPAPAHDQPHSPAGPVVPGPRTSPEAGAGGHVTASASVPVASRVTPPADQADLGAADLPAPQPRVYGRPTRPEPEDASGPDAAPEPGPRFDEPGAQSRMDEAGRPAGLTGFAEAPPVPSAPPSSPAGPPPFPPGVPSFADPAGNTRPVNGVHPQGDDHSGGQPDPYGPGGHHDRFGAGDPFGGPGGPQDPFGGPGGPQRFGGTGPGDPYGGPGRASVAPPGAPMGEPGQGGFPPGFPPPPGQAPPAWQQGPAGDSDQSRFDAFKPDAEPKTEAPTPKVRNGRVLAVVLIVAVLILAVPLGLLALLGKLGSDPKPAGFNPAVGSCIKKSGSGAADADCGEQGAFTVVSKVETKEQCGDPAQPYVVLPGDGPNRVLCLKPAGQ